jgi:hypothetical protein
VDPPRKPGFVPGNRRSRRHWIIGFLVLIFLLFWLPWISLNGWLASFALTLLCFALWFGVSQVNGVIARKVDPWKGAAPGDRVGSIATHRTDAKEDQSPPHPPAA